MKDRKIIALTLTAMMGLCLYTSGLTAWQRSAMDDCKKDMQNCKKSSDECKKDANACKMDAPQDDEASFVFSLSAYSNSLFKNFTPDQKKQAMDYADGNKMSTDDAVAKVSGQCKCP